MPTTMAAKKTTKKKTNRKAAGSTLPKKTAAQKQRAQRIFKALHKHYPNAHCELTFKNPIELIVAVILSAQSTDVGVNKATPALFKRYPTPKKYAQSTPEDIQEYIKTIGLFRNKSKSIHAAMTRIVEYYHGKVPDTMDELLTLRGVARKTANVVLGEAFNKAEGVVVDTHVSRISQRFGLTKHTEPVKIERDLMALFPRDQWTQLSHLLVWHGRYSCKARGANCAQHPVCKEFCSNAKSATTTKTSATKTTKKKTTRKKSGSIKRS